MKAELKTITPEYAAEMLALNHRNRRLDKRYVARLADDMKRGLWKINGNTICVNGTLLIDGQHRLQAVVDSGVSINCLVVEGLESDVFDTIDIGKKRSHSDTLEVKGEQNVKRLAAALILVERYMTNTVTNRQNQYTNNDVETMLEKYPGIRHSISKTHETKRLVPGSLLTACHYLFSEKDPYAANKFVHDLIAGHDLKPGDAVLLLRERLVSNAMSKAKLPREYIYALMIKAWNYRRDKRNCFQLRFNTSLESAEAFPVVR